MILLITVIVAGFYMSWNIGANDVANAMGTSVGSGALTLRRAVIIAAVLEFCGAYFFGAQVSETMQSGLIDVQMFQSEPMQLAYGMLASLIAAGAWLQIASYNGWPVSTTHTIVGALIGFGVLIGGIDAVHWSIIVSIVASWLISPLMGGILAFLTFSFFRKVILYSHSPLNTAKTIAPLIIFAVVFLLSVIMFKTGFKNIHHNMSSLQIVVIGAITGAAAALISYMLIRKYAPKTDFQNTTSIDSGFITSLDKVKKHLARMFSLSSGEPQHLVKNLIQQTDNLSNIVKNKTEVPASEYKAVEKIFAVLQICSASMMAFAHGSNDVSNAIGPLVGAFTIIQNNAIVPNAIIPPWALALGGFGIVVGLATWGWRVIETIGKKLTELTPSRGFSAEISTAVTILIASNLGLPVSTTHTLVGAVLGVGMARGIEALNLGMAKEILVSWIVTVPAGAVITVFFYYIIKFIFG